MLGMVPYHRPKSGHITCYLNRTYLVLLTSSTLAVDLDKLLTYRACHSQGPSSNSEFVFLRNRGHAVPLEFCDDARSSHLRFLEDAGFAIQVWEGELT
jgi:hypothetical protein